MADSPHPDDCDDISDATGAAPGGESSVGAPPWAKVFGIIGLALIVLVVVLLLVGGAGHGPGRHP